MQGKRTVTGDEVDHPHCPWIARVQAEHLLHFADPSTSSGSGTACQFYDWKKYELIDALCDELKSTGPCGSIAHMRKESGGIGRNAGAKGLRSNELCIVIIIIFFGNSYDFMVIFVDVS